MLVQGPVRSALAQELLDCEPRFILHTLNRKFLVCLEADEQKALLSRFNLDLLIEWGTPENLNTLTLPAKQEAVKLLLPAVGTLHPSVREIVLATALG
jgi:hypothetical protein